MYVNTLTLNNLKPGEIRRYKNAVTVDTVNSVIQLIKNSVKIPALRRTAEDIISDVPEKDWRTELKTIFQWVKNNMRYTRDFPDIEYVKTPLRHLKDIMLRGKAYGDCDDHTALLGTLLYNAGYKIRIVIIRSPHNTLGGFNHIYLHANIPYTDKWISLDPTAKDKPFGYEAKFINQRIFNI